MKLSKTQLIYRKILDVKAFYTSCLHPLLLLIKTKIFVLYNAIFSYIILSYSFFISGWNFRQAVKYLPWINERRGWKIFLSRVVFSLHKL